MYRPCSACGGTGFEEHVDRTLPPPPCRLCYPEEARIHLSLARDTRQVVTTRRTATYQMLRDAMTSGAASLAPDAHLT